MWGRLRRLKNNMYKKLIRFISQKIKSYSGRIRAKHFCNKYKHQGLNVKVGIGCWFGKNITADFIDGSGCLTIGDNIIIDGSTKFIISNNGDIDIGDNSNIRENSLFEVTNFGHITIGENCFFNKNATIVSMNSIKIGNDTDTNAALTGALAGYYYNSVPKNWIKNLIKHDEINNLLEQFIKNWKA